jgi:hypothetical protein
MYVMSNNNMAASRSLCLTFDLMTITNEHMELGM